MIYVRLTNGFGNNLFQYSAARILAEFHNTKVVAIPPTKDYYAIKSLNWNLKKNSLIAFKEIIKDNNW